MKESAGLCRGMIAIWIAALMIWTSAAWAQPYLELAPPAQWSPDPAVAPASLPSTTTFLPPAPPPGAPGYEAIATPPPFNPVPAAVPAPAFESAPLPQPNASGDPASPEPVAAGGIEVVDSGSWFFPYPLPVWGVPDGWDGSFEIGINGTEGNAQAFSFRTGGNIKRKIEKWEFTSDVIYAKTLSDGIETQHNAIFNAGYERFFGESPWSHFGKLNLEYDEFKAFDLRLAVNTGVGYQFVKTEAVSFKGRFGAGVSHEFDSPDDRWVPEAVFGGDYTHQISKRQKLSLTADYFPEWEDFNSYRLVTNLGWEMFLDDASNLSLKLSVNDRYDSTPNGRKPNDVIYSLLLLWKI